MGDACTDVFVYGTCGRLSPEAPVPVFIETRRAEVAGMAPNVAANVEALGCNVDRALPDSAIVKTRYIDERSMQHLLRVDHEPPLEAMARERIAALDVGAYDALVVVDYEKGFVDRSVAHLLASQARSRCVPVFVDTKKDDVGCFKGCIVKMNEHEQRQLRAPAPPATDLVVTWGKKGAVWNGSVAPAHEVQAFDECGAGDTFLAGLVYAYLRTGGDHPARMLAAMCFANSCAAVAVQHSGTHVLSVAEAWRLRQEAGFA